MVGRSRDVATPVELGQDCPPGPLDADEPAPRDVRHVVETLTDHDGPPVERCRHCERVAYPGAIDPFGVCPARRNDTPETDIDAETVSTP